MNPNKNRNRATPTFANINLFGKCNVNCYFCLGKDLEKTFAQYDQSAVHFFDWENFPEFLETLAFANIWKIYITGQNVDSCQYQYLPELCQFLRDRGFSVGIRTNGYGAVAHVKMFNEVCDLSIGYSFHTLDLETNKKMMGVDHLPEIDYLLKNTLRPRVSIVVTEHNVHEFTNLVQQLNYPNVRYIQARKVSTDTRQEKLKADQQAYNRLYNYVKKSKLYCLRREFYGAEIYWMKGMEVCFWPTVQTDANSYNYFTDGTISKEYFIIEGYVNAALGGVWPK